MEEKTLTADAVRGIIRTEKSEGKVERREEAESSNGEPKKEQISRLMKETAYELLHYYDRNRKKKVKDAVKKLAGAYVPPLDRIFWPTGMLANTLMENYEGWEDRDAVLTAVTTCFDRWIKQGMPLYCMDDVLSGEALLALYELTGEKRYKDGADRMAGYLYDLQDQAADGAGSVPYRPAQKNGHIYVDGTGMICPFLTRYGVMTGDNRAVELAATQLTNTLRYGMSDRMQLPYHGYEYDSRIKYGIIGWGRAVGWLMLGMAGTLVFLPKEHDSYRRLAEEFVNLVENVSAYQGEDGGFAWQLEAWSGPKDSSATAMIALAVLKGVKARILKEGDFVGRTLVKRASDFLVCTEKDGKIYECSGECQGFGQYSQTYGAYPWSLGPGLSVLISGEGER